MSKEIKEKCKECVYYNDKMEYPVVDGTTTHSNCMSIKCEYRKETKDMKIKRLTSKITDLEAKLAEKDQKLKEYELVIKLDVPLIKQLEEQLSNKEKEVANKVIERVKELSVFDFKAYEEYDFKRYTITDMALDNILKEYKGE